MITSQHQQHITQRISHNNCQECRADCERQFLHPQWPGYQFVTDYLKWAKPRLEAIRAGENSVNARIWRKDFRKALNRRINLKIKAETGRKQNDGYLERLGQFPRSTNDRPLNPSCHVPDADYLRRFAQRGASALN